MSQTQVRTRNESIVLTPIPNTAWQGQNPHSADDQLVTPPERQFSGHIPLSRLRLYILLFALTLDNFLTSFGTGLLTTSLPVIAKDLALSERLLLWPSSVYALTCGSLLLLAGSVGDILGNRVVYLTGIFLVGCFMLACGLARTAIQFITFRALQGAASSLCLTNSVSIVTKHVPSGRTRNIAFSCLGLSQVLGFSFGLVFGGIFADGIGWRAGWYISAAVILSLFVVCLYAIPSPNRVEHALIFQRLQKEIDWVGAGMASTSLALLSYVLSQITSDLDNMKLAPNIALLTTSVILIPSFGYWIGLRERQGKPALIPNTVWKSKAFRSTCFMVLSAYAVEEAMELFCSLFFQNIQGLSTLQSSLRLLPMCIMGTILNLTTGIFIHRVSALYLILVSSLLSAGAPLLMALADPRWPYWYAQFPSQVLQPMSVDVLFTVGMLVVSDIFPEDTQALAGGVFNSLAQLGVSLGLTVMGVVSRSVTRSSLNKEEDSIPALLSGYRASFWTAFTWTLLACCVGGFGLRKMGKVGLKRE